MPLFLKNQKTNWKYILIIVILAFIVGGGILTYQYWWLPQKKIELPEVKKEIKPIIEEFVEVSLDELKKGENEIGNINIEKIEPKLICDQEVLGRIDRLNLKVGEFVEIMDGEKKIKIGKRESYSKEEDREKFEVICNVRDKIKIKMIITTPFFRVINSIFVIDKNNKIFEEIPKIEPLDITDPEYVEYDSFRGEVKSFDYREKTYFFIHRGAYAGKAAGVERYFLFGIDKLGNIKKIASWDCNFLDSFYIKWGLGIGPKFYLETGKYTSGKRSKEIWEIDENDVLKNKFPANKLIIKDSKISFE